MDRSNGGSEGPRQGFDGFDELLTTCAAVNRLLVVEGTELEHGRIIDDWIFTRGPVRSIEPLVHRSVSASDHYPLSINVAFV